MGTQFFRWQTENNHHSECNKTIDWDLIHECEQFRAGSNTSQDPRCGFSEVLFRNFLKKMGIYFFKYFNPQEKQFHKKIAEQSTVIPPYL